MFISGKHQFYENRAAPFEFINGAKTDLYLGPKKWHPLKGR